MTMKIDITGDTAVIERMKGLTKAVTKRLIQRAGTAALKPLVATARAGVPRDTGTLKKSIGVKRAKKFKGGVLLMVGPRPGFAYNDADGTKHDPLRYGIPVEYGHSTKGGGFVAPAGFLRNAYNKHRISVVEDFGKELSARIDDYLARGA